MKNEEFVASLSKEQNTALLAYRDSLQAMYAKAESDLVSAHAEIDTTNLAAIEKAKAEKTAAETKASEDLAAKEAARIAEIAALKEASAAKLAEQDTKLFEAEKAKQAAKQELKDTFDLLGGDPNIKALKKQAAIEQADRDLAEAIKRKEDLVKV